MSLCYPDSPKKMAMTVGMFFSSAALFYYGLTLWYANAAPQRARIKARNEYVMGRLQRKYPERFK